MGVISNLFGYLLNWLYEFFNNYGIAIIVFSIILRLILIPITIKQQKTMKKSAEMQEKVKEIQKKYKNNPEKLNQETMNLYKREKVSPFSGCLSSILQIIIILCVFWLVSKPLTYMKKIEPTIIDNYINEIKEENGSISAYPEIEVIQKKGNNDEKVSINMNFFGLNLSKVPNQNLKDFRVYIIPILYVITSFISIRLTTNMQNVKKKEDKVKMIKETVGNTDNIDINEKDKQEETLESMQEMSKSMTYMMPIMSIFIAFIAPLGLALYWLISNILMILERILINKIMSDKNEED